MESNALTVADVAALAQVSIETVRRWIRAGELRAARLPGGRRYRVLRSDVTKVLPGVVETESPAERKKRAAADRAAIRAM